MSFRTGNSQFDSSINVDGSIYLNQQLLDYTLKLQPNPSTGLSGTVASSGIYVPFTAAATINSLQCVYLQSDGRVNVADADASNNMPAIAINSTGGTMTGGTTYNLLVYGPIRSTSFAAFQTGQIVCVSTSGYPDTRIPNTATDCVQAIGVATSPNSFIFNPSPDFIVLK